jgi:hypothetical protein
VPAAAAIDDAIGEFGSTRRRDETSAFRDGFPLNPGSTGVGVTHTLPWGDDAAGKLSSDEGRGFLQEDESSLGVEAMTTHNLSWDNNDDAVLDADAHLKKQGGAGLQVLARVVFFGPAAR